MPRPTKGAVSLSVAGPAVNPSGLSSTAKIKSSLQEVKDAAKKLKKRSVNTSRASTGPSATVIPMKSQSRKS